MLFFEFTECFNKLSLTLSTKTRGNEVSWSLGNCASNRTYEDMHTYNIPCCLSPGPHTLKCRNNHGHGWNGGFITIQGKKYCGDFSDHSESGTELSLEVPIIG